MYVKLDFSPDCKNHNYDMTRPGTYAIYIKKHWWNKWIQLSQTYADFGLAKRYAEEMSKMPIKF